MKTENENQKRKERNQTLKYLTLISQFGFNMLVPILICFFLGYFIDQKCHTNFWMIILFFFGAIVGFRNIYVMATGSVSKGSNHRNRDEDIIPEIHTEEGTKIKDKDKEDEGVSGKS